MITKKNSDVVLVYDRYYSEKPDAFMLAAQRVFLCCGINFCAVFFLLSIYKLPVSFLLAGVLCVVLSAVFSVMFILAKKRHAIPASLGFVALLIFINHDEFYTRFSYFTDAVWMLLDGRFVSGRILIEHEITELSADNPDYISGVTIGITLLILVFSIITAGSMFKKPRIIPSFVVWVVLWTPMLVSERFTFSWWLVPALAMYAGAFAMSLTHGDGLALKTGMGASYRAAAANSERDYLKALGKSPYGKRTEMSAVYYSKYFSVAVYAGAVFALLGVVSGALLSKTSGVDYTKVYDFFVNLGKRSGINSGNGPMSEYFASPSNNVNNSSAGLTVTSPGRSNQEILRVTNAGDAAVYLRGDIGIDFDGKTTWSTPVNNEPIVWRTFGLDKFYRPVEVSILHSLQYNYYGDMTRIVDFSDVTVEYLVESDVAFLPAYTSDFGYYENDMFNIYGDFVARVDSSYGRMNSVQLTAYVPRYTYTDEAWDSAALEAIRNALTITDEWDMASAADGFFGIDGAYGRYENYVNQTYMGVPKNMKGMLDEYLESTGLGVIAQIYLNSDFADVDLDHEIFDSIEISHKDLAGRNELRAKYRVAYEICKYLYSNYTYSLDAEMVSAPIDTFLNETKSGHCALYATSMTLLLRELGIPARYCTGFVARPNGGEPEVLRSKNLHAWCEVYLSGLGWVTFDPTSSSQNPTSVSHVESSSSDSSEESSESFDDSSDSSEESSESDSSDISESSEQSEDSTEHSGGDSSSGEKTRINVIPYVLAVLVIILLAALCAAAVQRYKKFLSDVEKALKRYYKEDDAGVILDKILAVMRVCGLSPGKGELPDKFYERAEGYFGCAVTEHKDLLEAVAFGDDAADEMDCVKLAGLLTALYNSAEKELKFPKKMKLRFTVLSKK